MPIFKDYSPDGKLLDTREEPLTEKNLPRFIAEHGEEKARIYLEALADFNREVEDIAFRFKFENSMSPNTPHRAKKQATDFYNHNKALLKFGKTILGDEPSKTNDAAKPDAILPR